MVIIGKTSPEFFVPLAPFVVDLLSMKLCLWSCIWFIGMGGGELEAQFSSNWLQDGVWGDGKAEFNIYEAQEVRYGQPRPAEILHIFVREPFAEKEGVKPEPGSKAASYPVMKLNQILHIPTGVYVYQQMHSAFWRTDTGQLAKATLTSNDSCGNTYKEFRLRTGLAGWFRPGWQYEWRTYWEGMSRGESTLRAPESAIFYDELPMRVRTIDFARGSGRFEIQLAPTIINSKAGAITFSSATVDWIRATDGAIEVSVGSAMVEGTAGKSGHADRFRLEARSPHVIQSWHRSDGSGLKLKRSLRLDYWNYHALGDKERVLETGITN